MDLNLLTSNEAERLKGLIAAANHIVLVGHSHPDGDAIGSCLAWSAYLREHFGKESKIIVPNAYPDFLHWLPCNDRIVRHDKHADTVKAMLKECDLLFCLDFNQLSRTETLADDLTACQARRVVFDHHLGLDIPAYMTVSFPDLSSTSEIVFRIAWQLGGFDTLSKMFAVPVYCGMMTDTGGFTFNSKRPEIYYIICELLTKGIDKDRIYRNVYNNFSPWAIRLRGYLMSQKLNVFNDLHASYYTLTRKEMKDYHFMRGDADGLVNEPLRIKGLKCSISMREDDRVDNRIWVSLRSVDNFSVEEMAKRFFNGGGHFNASGGRLDCTMDEAERVARKAIAFYADKLR